MIEKELDPKKVKRKIIIKLVTRFNVEYEQLLNGKSNFNNEEKLHITETFLEIVNLRKKGVAEGYNISELYKNELRKKYRDRFAEGDRMNFLAYFYDGAILDKSRGTGEFDFYTKEEFNNLESSEFQLLSESEIEGLLWFIGNYLSSTLGEFLDKPKTEEELQTSILGDNIQKADNKNFESTAQVNLIVQEPHNKHKRIFINGFAYEFFEKLREEIATDPKHEYADYSFIFQRMKKDNYLIETNHQKFINFLDENCKTKIGKSYIQLNTSDTIEKRKAYSRILKEFKAKINSIL